MSNVAESGEEQSIFFFWENVHGCDDECGDESFVKNFEHLTLKQMFDIIAGGRTR